MRKLFAAIALSAALIPVGCVKPNTTTTPAALAPGYANSADQAMGQALVGAHAFYVTIQGDVASGKYKPSAAEKASLNNFATALNAAQIIYIGYHSGVNTQVQAQAAVNAVVAQQGTLQSTLTGGK